MFLDSKREVNDNCLKSHFLFNYWTLHLSYKLSFGPSITAWRYSFIRTLPSRQIRHPNIK
jgi:hypothetical protein